MSSFRSILKVCLPAIIIGTSGFSIGRCANQYKYEVISYELKSDRPQCAALERKLSGLKRNNSVRAWKYIAGAYGEIEAYEDYAEANCRD